MTENKSGYQYLKEKVSRLSAENNGLRNKIIDLKQEIEQWEKKCYHLEDEHERESFERMVKGIRVVKDWEGS